MEQNENMESQESIVGATSGEVVVPTEPAVTLELEEGESTPSLPTETAPQPAVDKLDEAPDCVEEKTQPQLDDAKVDDVVAKLTDVEREILDKVVVGVDGLIRTGDRLLTEFHELHKLYHNEYAGRLKSMQTELDSYHDIDRGRVFDEVLGEIARIYNAYETLPEDVDDPKAKKQVGYLLDDLKDLAESRGMKAFRSEPCSKRNPRLSQIVNRVPCDDPEKHDTVAKSHNTGFQAGARVVVKERVDVYFYGNAPQAEN